jgi:hypothetical protein
MGGVVNADALATLVGSLVVWGLARGLRRGFRARTWLLIVAGILGSFVAKRTGFALVVPAAVAAVGSLRRLRLAYVLAGAAVGAVFLSLAVATAIGIPPLDRANRYFLNEPDQITRLFDGRLTDPRALELVELYLLMLHASFWGVFGWFSVRMPDELYQVLGGQVVLGGLGLGARGARAVAVVRRAGGTLCRREVAIAVFCPTFAFVLVAMAVAEQVSYFRPTGFPQGRYLFIGIAAIATSLAVGWRAFLPRHVVGSWAPAAVLIAAMLALDAFAWFQVFLPYYVVRSIV